MMIFKNCNGLEYEVLAVCGYNKIDLDYYKYETHRLCAYALLQDLQGNCVVACVLNTCDWGNGIYFMRGTYETDEEVLAKARACYDEKVKGYLGE